MVFIFVFLIVLLDQLTKLLAVRTLVPGQSIPVLKSYFHLTLVCNTGAAFGIFPDATFFFLSISSVIILIIGYRLWTIDVLKKREREPKTSIALALILAGAIGNLIDRLRFGYVVDFLDFFIWPVFNFADTVISVGVVLLIWKFISVKFSKR